MFKQKVPHKRPWSPPIPELGPGLSPTLLQAGRGPGQGGVLGLELHSEMGQMGMARQPRSGHLHREPLSQSPPLDPTSCWPSLSEASELAGPCGPHGLETLLSTPSGFLSPRG